MRKYLKTALAMLLMVGQTSAPLASQSQFEQQARGDDSVAEQRRFHQGNVLESISSYQTYQPKQALADFDQLHQQAQQAQTELAMLTQKSAYLSATQALIPAVKSEQRAQAKLTADLGGDVSRLTDLARSSLVADDIDGVVRAYRQISKEVEVIRVKNRFATPKANGYRDMNLVVRLPYSGHLAEVQIHLTEIAAIKNGPEHDIYQQIQHIERSSSPLTEFDNARISKLRQQSSLMYQQAWRDYIAPVRQVS
ncbi:RelA/SpoT domain-containing protein [uncultured Ferrimonas sp.]|uniref:RelA/SpoT domain-containing protein n=1 Tax=uncultured Ferrimonas sp. TaxID=432640 RepID=UPI00261BA9DF|nr:RelA/SpoT domain-containing protein [uncultured Ferrimonas sp.]